MYQWSNKFLEAQFVQRLGSFQSICISCSRNKKRIRHTILNTIFIVRTKNKYKTLTGIRNSRTVFGPQIESDNWSNIASKSPDKHTYITHSKAPKQVLFKISTIIRSESKLVSPFSTRLSKIEEEQQA